MLNLKKDLKKILCAGILSIFLYSFLHELGHCIAVWFYGGKVTEFQFILLWNAHMSYEWDEIVRRPLVYLAGSLFPTLIAFCMLFTYRRNSGRTFVYYLKTLYIYVCIVSLSSWIFLPILFLNGVWELTDDVYKFLFLSEISPVVIILTVTAAVLLIVFIFINRITATASSEWQRKNIRRMGIWLTGVLMIQIFILPLYARLDALPENGSIFRLTEKDGSPDSFLKKQYEVEIEDSGTYVFKVNLVGECSGMLTGLTLSRGDETVLYFTAGKISAEFNLENLESGTYILSLYSISSMKEWETFYTRLGKDVPELEDYNFQGNGRYAIWGKYDFIKK